MGFERWSAFWALLAVPILVLAYSLDGVARRRVLERIGHLPQVQRMVAWRSVWRRRWKAILTTVAVGLLAVALAQPQTPGTAHLAPQRGLDLVVALDFSKSMLTADVYPSRLDRAKRELDQLIDGLRGDRVGLVAFAGVTLSYPLTTDYPAAKLFWRDLGPDDIPVGGTNLSGAVHDALELLQHGGAKLPGQKPPAQVIVLLTDGADTEGGSIEAAREAARRGVKIYTVGIGTPGGDFVAIKRNGDGTAEYLTDKDGQPVRMQLDSDTLRQVAQITGGEFFQVDPARFGVDRVQRAIAGLERSEEKARVVQEPEEAYPLFLGPAFLLLLLEALLGERRWRGRQKPPPAPPGASGPGRMAVLTLLLIALLPGLTGFDLLSRPHPDVEEGNRLMAAGKAAEALAAYDRALASRPDDPAIHYDRGAALYQLGKLPEARAEFQRAAEAQGVDPALKADALYNMGNSLLRQEQAKDAIDAYKRTLGLRPDDRRAKWNLELALRRLREQQQQQQSADGKPKDEPQEKKEQEKKQGQQDKKDQQKQGDPQQQPPQAKDQPGRGEDRKPEERQGAGQERAPAEQKPEPKPQPQPMENAQENRPGEKPQAPAQAGQAKAPRDIDRQDAEAVLDAFERVEPTVQKDLARRRAGNRRPRKDW
jgi:Ca-activated chloride channel homolog